MPNETTICKLRHLLEAHRLSAQLFARIGEYLAAQGLTVNRGTIVDVTIISAPSSTKNRAKERDPEMHQTKKGNQWGDAAYSGQHDVIQRHAPDAQSFIQAKAHRHRPLSEAERAKNRTKAKVRAKVEHAFLGIKRLFGWAKVRYRRLAKNTN